MGHLQPSPLQALHALEAKAGGGMIGHNQVHLIVFLLGMQEMSMAVG